MRTIAIINQKGGSGKTTTAINLAGVLARRGQKTLLVDMDPQSHCALGLSIPESEIDLHIGDAMLAPDNRPVNHERLLWHLGHCLDLAPSTTKLAGLEAARGGLADREDRDTRLAIALRHLNAHYDWCLIDCPPSIGLLTFNALRAAQQILIPVETAFFAMEGATKQVGTLRAISRRFGAKRPFTIVPTLHDPSSTLASDVLNELEKRFPKELAPAVIRFDPRLKEAASLGVPIIDFDPQCRGASDYTQLAHWFMESEAPPSSLESESAQVPEPDSPHVNVLPISVGASANGGRERETTAERPPEADEQPVGHTSDSTHIHAARSISRAAELAARARLLQDRSEDMARRQYSDERVARVLERLEPAPPPQTITEPDPAPASTAERVFGARVTSRGALFVQPGGPQACILVACDQSDWIPIPMMYDPQISAHQLLLPMQSDLLRYRIIVNGQWLADPYNSNTEPNPFGGVNSVLIADRSGASASLQERNNSDPETP